MNAEPDALEVTILTGMSGAGRSTAADALEDVGFFVIDNLPPALIGKVADLADHLLVVGDGANTQTDLLLRFAHLDDLEITLLPYGERRRVGTARPAG